jgi:hypothetical protein
MWFGGYNFSREFVPDVDDPSAAPATFQVFDTTHKSAGQE